MKCLNSECERLDADELNISLNLSGTTEEVDFEYTGSTDYGDPSDFIGTYCSNCGFMYEPDATESVLRFLGLWSL